MRLARAATILAILTGLVAAGVGVMAAVSSWRAPDSSAGLTLIRTTRLAVAAEGDLLTDAITLPQRARRRAAAAAWTSLAAAQQPRLQRLRELSHDDLGARRAQTLHARAISLATQALAAGTPGGARFDLMLGARSDLRAMDEPLSAARASVRPKLWPNGPLDTLEAIAVAVMLAAGGWRLIQIARSLAGLRFAIDDPRELERLHDAAHTDSLTGLGNHRAFYDHLAREIKRRAATGSTFSLLAIDLDGLKRVNDEHGHPAGDEFIKKVAYTARMEADRSGAIYRTGGDEFMVLLPNRRAWSALAIAQNIQRATTEATGQRALSVGVTESVNTESARALINQADVALYEAKRNKLLAVIYRPGLEPKGKAQIDAMTPTANQRALAAALAHAIDAKDSGERNHCETVAELSVGVGARVGIPQGHLERLRLAGLVHDVGKIGLPDVILQKPGALESDERAELEQHVTIGHAILLAADLDTEAEWVLHHHERYDGAGYPAGLAGEEIPLASRVLAVADAYETMTGGRPYRTRLSPETALAELRDHSGQQFDPDCVDGIADLLGYATPAEAGVEPSGRWWR